MRACELAAATSGYCSTGHNTQDYKNYEDHNKDKEQDLGNSGRRRRDTRDSKQCCDDRDGKEEESPFEHAKCLSDKCVIGANAVAEANVRPVGKRRVRSTLPSR